MAVTLNDLKNAISTLYPAAKPGVDYTLATDTSGNSTIALWNNALGAQPTTAQITAAVSTYSLSSAKAAQLAILQAASTAAATANLVYGTHTFPTDQATVQLAKDAYIAAQANGGTMPANFYVLDINGARVTVTLAQLQAFYNAVFAQRFAAQDKYNTLAAQVAAASTVAAVQAVVWS